MSEAHLYPVPAFMADRCFINEDQYEAMYRRSVEDPEGFWAEQADIFIDWYEKWDTVCEQDMTDSKPMEKKPTVSFEKLLQAVSLGNTEEDVLSSIAGRLARMAHRATEEDEQRIREQTHGFGLKDLSKNLVDALNPDLAPDAREASIEKAVRPFYDPKVREQLDIVRQKNGVVFNNPQLFTFCF